MNKKKKHFLCHLFGDEQYNLSPITWLFPWWSLIAWQFTRTPSLVFMITGLDVERTVLRFGQRNVCEHRNSPASKSTITNIHGMFAEQCVGNDLFIFSLNSQVHGSKRCHPSEPWCHLFPTRSSSLSLPFFFGSHLVMMEGFSREWTAPYKKSKNLAKIGA